MRKLFNFGNKKTERSRDKLKTMAVSVFFAIAIWLMVVYMNDPSITITLNNVDVRCSGELALRAKGLAVTGKNDLPSMSVSVSGKRSDLMDYMNSIYLKIDVEDVTETGEQEFTTSVEMPNSRLTLEKGGNEQIMLDIEPLEHKSVQVLTKQTGANKNYYIKSEIEDDYIDITGAKSEVDNVAYALAAVDISLISEKTSGEYSYAMYDKSNAVIDKNETLEAHSPSVHIINTPYTKKTLPVIPQLSDELEKGYMLDRAETVVYPPVIEAGVSADFSGEGVTANIDKLTGDETEFYLNQDSGIYVPYEKSVVKVKPVIIKKLTKQMKLNITAKNLGEGLSAEFNHELDAQVECAEETEASDITAEIDLSGLTAGTHRVPVTVSGTRVVTSIVGETEVTIK